MKTANENKISKKDQIDRMLDDGLGAGRVVEPADKKKLESEREKKKRKEEINEKENGVMVEDMEELKKLGNEMDQMKTNKEVKSSGKVPDPTQNKK